MEINGIDFENWAAACAHLAQGMSENDICNVLGIELPVWQETMEQWSAKLGDLMAEDMNVATQYGDIFANPKVGKFAGEIEGVEVATLDDLLKKVPDFDAYQKIFIQQATASEHGVDPVSVLEENGLNLQTWGQLNMHFMKWHNEYMDSDLIGDNPAESKKRYDEVMGISAKWEAYWKDFYKENAVDLSDDIDF